jgi:hypothetical protein
MMPNHHGHVVFPHLIIYVLSRLSIACLRELACYLPEGGMRGVKTRGLLLLHSAPSLLRRGKSEIRWCPVVRTMCANISRDEAMATKGYKARACFYVRRFALIFPMSAHTPLQSFVGGLGLSLAVHGLLVLNGAPFGVSGFIHRTFRGDVEAACSVLGLILGGVVVGKLEGTRPPPLPISIGSTVLAGLLVGIGTKVSSSSRFR